MAAGKYTEGLRLVTVQPGGRSAAHMHSGFEAVFVLEGRVLIRSGGSAPTFLSAGQGFYILPSELHNPHIATDCGGRRQPLERENLAGYMSPLLIPAGALTVRGPS